MDEQLAHKDLSPVLREIPRVEPAPEPIRLPVKRPAGYPPLNLLLFLAAMLTTTIAGAEMAGAPFSIWSPIATLPALEPGLWFSIPLMAILGAHEMGHYITARIHRVDASLPYFIPAPTWPIFGFIGTFGAFIRIREMPRSRRVMFDIGAAGPWAGMLIAVPAVIIGLKLSSISPLGSSAGGLELGNSILFYELSRLVLHVDPNLVNVDLNPVAFAGWIGFLVTTLNLFPIGQLDGGHVIYALFGRWHRRISILFVAFCFAMVVFQWALGMNFWLGWILWAVLILIIIGVRHPATLDAETPLDGPRRIAAWLTVLLFIVTFVPVPVWVAGPSAEPPPGLRNNHSYSVMLTEPAPAARARRALERIGVRL